MENQLTVVKDGTLGSFQDKHGILTVKDSLLGPRRYIAKQTGLTPEDIEKKTTKEVKELCVAAGASREQIANWIKDYNGSKQQYYSSSAILVGGLASDSRWRKSARRSFNTKGEFIGFTATFRKERNPQASTLAVQNAELRARIAQLEAQTA